MAAARLCALHLASYHGTARLFLIDGMDEAGQQAELVESMLVEQIIGRAIA